MKKQLIIHIGYPKCGSTYLQEMFYPNHPDIEYLGKRNPVQMESASLKEKLYRAMFLSSKHVTPYDEKEKLPESVRDYDKQIKAIHSPEWISNIYLKPPFYWDENYTKEQFENILQNSNKNVLCFSDEGLAGDPIYHPHFTYRSAVRLKKLWPDAKIIIIVRNQLSLLDSIYRMDISSGGYCKFENMLNYDENWSKYPRPTIYMSLLKFDMLINFYLKLFGEENVTVLLFEDFINDPRAFINTLCRRLGISEYVTKDFRSKVNKGVELNAFLKIKRFVNSLMTTRKHPDQFFPYIPLGLLSLGSRFGKKQERLSKEERFRNFYGSKVTDEIIYYYAESNKNLSTILKRDIKELGYHF